MAGIKDFLFGSGSLKKAAGDSSKSEKYESAGIDMGKLARDSAESAERAKAIEAANPKSSGKSPLSSPMTPQPHKKGK